MNRYIRAACRLSGYTEHDFKMDWRKADLVKWRHAAMYVARQSGLSFPAVGRLFRRDHTTVVYACKRAAACEHRLALAWQIALAVKSAPGERPLALGPRPSVLGAQSVCLGSRACL